MPLPAFLSSSYHQYKEDQKVFTTWLQQTARACGYKSKTVGARGPTDKAPKAAATEVITAPTQRLKGKARKQAKQSGSKPVEVQPKPIKSVSYSMPIAELTECVRAVCGSRKPGRLPAGIQRVLQRVIAARKRCAAWYNSVGADPAANVKHRHFIGVLQNALDLLQPQDAQVDGDEKAIPVTVDTKLSNKFEGLHVDEPDDEYPLTAAEASVPNPKAGNEREIFELDEEDANFEGAFRLYCFFEDLHTIQDEIRKVWQRFVKGEVSLKIATIVTHAGINMIKRLDEQEPKRDNSCEHHGSKHPHINLALPVLYADAIMAGEDPEELLNTPRALEHREFYEFIYLPTAKTLMKFADVAYQVKDKVAWPFPVMPMRFSYIVRPELLELPEFKRLEKEDQVLTQMLLDVFLIDDSKHIMRKQGLSDGSMLPTLQDEFANSARTLWQTGTVSTYAVFTSRLVLDILDICGGSSRPRFARLLLEEGERAENTMDYIIHPDGSLDTRDARWLAKDTQLLMDLHRLITLHIPDKTMPHLKGLFLEMHAKEPKGGSLEDAPPEVRAEIRRRMIERGQDPDAGPTEEHKRNAEKLDLKAIEPSSQHDFLQTHNAMHCGSLSLNLTVKMEEAGIALANHHMSVFAVAHLYNAWRQLGATETQWPDMDRIIDLHVNALFANDIPKTPLECLKRMEYRTNANGISGANFDRKQPWKLRCGAASESLRKLLDSQGSVEQALLQLETQIEEHAVKPTRATKSKNNTSALGRRRQLNPAQVLSRFQTYLPVVLADMELDYISLTKTCNALIKAIRTALRDELGIRVPTSQAPGESNDHSVLAVVLLILDGNQKGATVHGRRSREVFKGSAEMMTACRAFEEFFRVYVVPRVGAGDAKGIHGRWDIPDSLF